MGHIKSHAAETQFRVARSGDGITREIDKESNFYFLVGGSWSHLSLHFGIHFKSVGRLIENTIINIEGLSSFKGTFANRLVGLLNKPVGDFCLSERDLGVYCPPESRVSSVETVIKEMEGICDTFMGVSSIRDCINFAWNHKVLDIGSRFQLPAACVLDDNAKIFENSVDLFKSDKKFRCDDAYDRYIACLRSMLSDT